MRHADPDRYLSVLYAPEEKRGALFALYGFNAEIASVRDRIHDPLPGEIRLQWWRDIITAGTPESAGGYPLATALLLTIHQHALPLQAFDNYLEARIFDLYDDPMPSRTDLEGYCGETASCIIQLAALILDPKAAPNVAELAGHAGCAQAIAGLLRLLPLHRARGQCYVPEDILAASGASVATLLEGKDTAALERIVSAMTALARDHLAAFNKAAATILPSMRPAFLPLALVPAYLDAVERRGARTALEVVEIPAWKRHWLLFRAAGWGF
ncbi:phytoene/squalene synthase family protein [Mesorhizobium denitrificans]|uniref:Phytoene/squalene synthase family protein n=1 Tax=Mesorhizobium denitrificans TaxID=2294114 RepID=A0A371XDU3_9HYPH|nr:phytoene/squalene synthase family protein [Mesorhizobium denitrificans]